MFFKSKIYLVYVHFSNSIHKTNFIIEKHNDLKLSRQDYFQFTLQKLNYGNCQSHIYSSFLQRVQQPAFSKQLSLSYFFSLPPPQLLIKLNPFYPSPFEPIKILLIVMAGVKNARGKVKWIQKEKDKGELMRFRSKYWRKKMKTWLTFGWFLGIFKKVYEILVFSYSACTETPNLYTYENIVHFGNPNWSWSRVQSPVLKRYGFRCEYGLGMFLGICFS